MSSLLSLRTWVHNSHPAVWTRERIPWKDRASGLNKGSMDLVWGKDTVWGQRQDIQDATVWGQRQDIQDVTSQMHCVSCNWTGKQTFASHPGKSHLQPRYNHFQTQWLVTGTLIFGPGSSNDYQHLLYSTPVQWLQHSGSQTTTIPLNRAPLNASARASPLGLCAWTLAKWFKKISVQNPSPLNPRNTYLKQPKATSRLEHGQSDQCRLTTLTVSTSGSGPLYLAPFCFRFSFVVFLWLKGLLHPHGFWTAYSFGQLWVWTSC